MLMMLLFVVVYTLVIISLLKWHGWITVHPQNVRSNRARQLFELAIQLGDIIVAKSADLFAMVASRASGNAQGLYRPGPPGVGPGFDRRPPGNAQAYERPAPAYEGSAYERPAYR
jgi:hypothetical protein